MRFVKPYRRITLSRALKPWSHLFTVDPEEIASSLIGGRL
jgi:hypothetical protein